MMSRPDTRIYAWLFVGATPAANFPAFQLRYEPLNRVRPNLALAVTPLANLIYQGRVMALRRSR